MSNEPTEYIELRKKRDFSAVISTGFQFIRQNWKELYRPLVFICLPIYLVASVFFGSFFRTMYAGQSSGNVGMILSGMGSMLLGYVLMGISMLLLYAMVFEYMRFYMVNKGMKPTMGELWKEVKGQLGAYFVIGLLVSFITSAGLILFIVGALWLAIVFVMAFPLRAFERADIGDCIGRSFTVIKGNWWRTFALVVILGMMVSFIGYIIYLPFVLLTGFGAMSGVESMNDPSAMGERMGWLMTGLMIASGVMYVLLLPLLQVPIALHALSLIEEKEGRGLMDRVNELQVTPKAS
ncbi:MAG: hypothetical protein ABIY71_11485 [Flavobacteriales bacterium]